MSESVSKTTFNLQFDRAPQEVVKWFNGRPDLTPSDDFAQLQSGGTLIEADYVRAGREMIAERPFATHERIGGPLGRSRKQTLYTGAHGARAARKTQGEQAKVPTGTAAVGFVVPSQRAPNPPNPPS